MVHVLAFITTKPGMRPDVLALFNAMVPAVRAEDGCIEYGAVVDLDGAIQTPIGADRFVVVEKWESLDDLNAHTASAHMASFAAQAKDMLAERIIHVMRDATLQT